MELVSKLTPKSLGFDRNVLGAECKTLSDEGSIKLGRFVGIVTGLRHTVDEEKGGEIQTGLKGTFRGISTLNRMVPKMDGDKPVRDDKDKIVMLDTGEKIVVTSGVCYLPSGLQDMIEGAFVAARENDPKATVNFAIDLYGIKANNKAGYSFKAENIVAPTHADPLAMLLEQADAHSQGKLLAGPGETADAETGEVTPAKSGKK